MNDCQNCIHYEIVKTESSSFCLCSKAFEMSERRRHNPNVECEQYKSRSVSIPIPYRLNQWGSGREVIYKCAECGADFRILGDQEEFCHRCGAKQNWSNSPRYCSAKFKEEYDRLVYEEHAYVGGQREVDKELRNLLFSFHKGDFR